MAKSEVMAKIAENAAREYLMTRPETWRLATLPLVLDIGLRTGRAGGGFGMPLAVGGLVFDRLGAARHALLGGGAFGGGKGLGMGRKAFRKHAVHGVGPAAVMLDDLVSHMAHGELAFAGAVTGVNASAIL